MKKRDIGFVAGVFAFCASSLLINLKPGRLDIYPFASGSGLTHHVAQEMNTSDPSQASSSLQPDGSLRFEYTLSKTVPYPFAGVFINKVWSPDSHLDFSQFDEIRITLRSLKGKKIPITLMIDTSAYFPKSEPFPDTPLMKVIDYDGEHEYRIRKQDLEVPDWWLQHHQLHREQIGPIDYSKARFFFVNNSQDLEHGQKDVIFIKNISFIHDNRAVYLFHAGLMLVLICAGALAKAVASRRRGTSVEAITAQAVPSGVHEIKIPITYQPKDIEKSKTDSKIARIVGYIATHYANPELSVQDMEKALGISAREIGTLIKSELDSSFKSYLNMIRLAEVKMLLQETALTISEIAYKTGYNNISHFNRVFKSELGVSPKEFRSDARDSVVNP